ncbi:MAG TPA: site-specific integrase [Mycobacterium sp.]
MRRDYTRHRDRPTKRVAPLLLDDIARILTATRAGAGTWTARVVERRDSALLLLGFAGAFRRSELAGLRLGDVTVKPGIGLHIRVASSKADQDGHGHTKALTHGTSHLTCPPCAYRRWLDVLAAHHRHGRPGVMRLLSDPAPWDGHVCGTAGPRLDPGLPVFRPIRGHGRLGTDAITGAAIHKALRRNLTHAGYPDEDVATFGTHSARAGFVTQALLNGATAHAIMRQTGHASPAMIETYAREDAPSVNNAVMSLGM